jgi:hypothetical protein
MIGIYTAFQTPPTCKKGQIFGPALTLFPAPDQRWKNTPNGSSTT